MDPIMKPCQDVDLTVQDIVDRGKFRLELRVEALGNGNAASLYGEFDRGPRRQH